MSNNSKQYAYMTDANRKLIIDMLKKSECFGAGHSTLQENIHGCD